MSGTLENPFIRAETERFGLEASKLHNPLMPTYAQRGEDLIVEALLHAHLAKQGRHWDSLFYIEIGANHPISTSNTYLLYSSRGASGVLVEPNPELHPLIAKARARDTLVAAAILPAPQPSVTLHIGNAHELTSVDAAHVESFGAFGGAGGIRNRIEVPGIGINELFAAHAANRPFDFLSIDCEGIDHELAKAIDFETFKPAVVQLEPSDHFFPGARARMVNLMESRSYRLVAMTEINVIFLRAW